MNILGFEIRWVGFKNNDNKEKIIKDILNGEIIYRNIKSRKIAAVHYAREHYVQDSKTGESISMTSAKNIVEKIELGMKKYDL